MTVGCVCAIIMSMIICLAIVGISKYGVAINIFIVFTYSQLFHATTD